MTALSTLMMHRYARVVLSAQQHDSAAEASEREQPGKECRPRHTIILVVFPIKHPFQVSKFDVLIECKCMQMNHHLPFKPLGFGSAGWKKVSKK